MPLTIRPPGLGHGVYKDAIDYSIFAGEWNIGRIYEVRGGPRASTVVLGVALSKQAGEPSNR
jgi:hypothetical protein